MRKISLLSLTLLLLFIGCNQEKQLKKKLTKTIVSYCQDNLDQYKNIDSVQIMSIEKFTDIDFIFMQKLILKNAQEEAESNLWLHLEPQNAEERFYKDELEKQLTFLNERIFYCDSVLLDEQTDTTTINHYFVASKVFGKTKQGEQLCEEIGFPISMDGKVEEINLFYDEN